uniref:Tetratricopeptide repeat protein n=1 Tax=Desulfobacca acetoxidans TaxID=60893 RepID=A0A7C3V4K5_9BACT
MISFVGQQLRLAPGANRGTPPQPGACYLGKFFMRLVSLGCLTVFLILVTAGLGFSADSASKSGGDQAQAFLRQGEAAFNNGDYDGAAQAYRQAVKVKPNLAPAHYGLGLSLARQERYQEAAAAFQEALQHKPSYTQARKDLGVAYLKLKRWPEAEKAFKSCLKEQPQDPETYYGLGLAEGKQGKHQEARESFEKALRLKPDYVPAWNNLGMANIKLNRWAEAKSSFEKALSLKSDNAEAHLGLLACYIQQGDSEAAARTYRTLAAMDKALRKKADEILGR